MLGVDLDGSRRIEAAHVGCPVGPDGYRRIVWMIIGMIKAHPTANRMPSREDVRTHAVRWDRYAECMTVRDMLTALQTLPRDAELLAFEAGCEDYCEREVDEVEWQGGRVYLHLGAHRDGPPRR
jgi:hypothetical protein